MRNTKIVTTALGLCLGACMYSGFSDNTLVAETLVIENTAQFYSDAKPKKGISKAQVRKKYGEPVQTYAPVGQPPITRWRYKDFIVYFEYNNVIHAVANRKR
ncbi:MAG: hypothetical protein HKN88_00140 [Gammaproteobacteria bacterium]|nr:hypothetical protein [Gammaproteobacteria bacterium]NNM14507.1 hypothetical protein [Gammaproteobacteria bacterium]